MRVFLEEHRIGTPHVPQITVENFLKSVKTHSLKSVCIRSYLVRIFPAFSRIRTEYGEIRIQFECGKMRKKCGPE